MHVLHYQTFTLSYSNINKLLISSNMVLLSYNLKKYLKNHFSLLSKFYHQITVTVLLG